MNLLEQIYFDYLTFQRILYKKLQSLKKNKKNYDCSEKCLCAHIRYSHRRINSFVIIIFNRFFLRTIICVHFITKFSNFFFQLAISRRGVPPGCFRTRCPGYAIEREFRHEEDARNMRKT